MPSHFHLVRIERVAVRYGLELSSFSRAYEWKHLLIATDGNRLPDARRDDYPSVHGLDSVDE